MEPCRFLFSKDGLYFSHVGNDGKLRLWDTASCTLKQEYTPNFHLVSPFTQIKWLYMAKTVATTSKKCEDTFVDARECEFLAIGTQTGDVLLYSVASAKVVNTLKSEKNSKVAAIAWPTQVPEDLYVCSDQSVANWSLKDCQIKKQWKCGPVSSAAVSSDGKFLVTGWRDIKWWNIEKESLIRTFIGHSSNVISLTMANISNKLCVLSASLNNRLIHAWALDESDTGMRQAIATFNVTDSPTFIDVCHAEDGTVSLLATTSSGLLNVFRCALNGKKVKPAKANSTLQIVSESINMKSEVEKQPILSATLCQDGYAQVVYGLDNNLQFEKMALNDNDKVVYLVRPHPKKSLADSKGKCATKVLPRGKNKSVQFVHPDNVKNRSELRTKRDSNCNLKNEDTLELKVGKNKTASSDSLVHLLLQGLRSKDGQIIQDTLLDKDDHLIKTTVSRLPMIAITPLSQELIAMLEGNRRQSEASFKWIKCILTIHAAHLTSNPDMVQLFAPIFPIIDSKLETLTLFYKLRGKLDLLIDQIENRTASVSQVNLDTKARLTLQDEDVDEMSEDDASINDERTCAINGVENGDCDDDSMDVDCE